MNGRKHMCGSMQIGPLEDPAADVVIGHDIQTSPSGFASWCSCGAGAVVRDGFAIMKDNRPCPLAQMLAQRGYQVHVAVEPRGYDTDIDA